MLQKDERYRDMRGYIEKAVNDRIEVFPVSSYLMSENFMRSLIVFSIFLISRTSRRENNLFPSSNCFWLSNSELSGQKISPVFPSKNICNNGIFSPTCLEGRWKMIRIRNLKGQKQSLRRSGRRWSGRRSRKRSGKRRSGGRKKEEGALGGGCKYLNGSGGCGKKGGAGRLRGAKSTYNLLARRKQWLVSFFLRGDGILFGTRIRRFPHHIYNPLTLGGELVGNFPSGPFFRGVQTPEACFF